MDKPVFLTKSEGKGYVSLKLDMSDATKLFNILHTVGIKGLIKPEDMHITLMYDKSNPSNNFIANSNEKYSASIKDSEPLGSGEWAAITLILEAPEIVKRHEYLKKLGYTHSYPEYIPHLSVKYKPEPDDLLKIKLALNRIKNAMGSELCFSFEQAEAIK